MRAGRPRRRTAPARRGGARRHRLGRPRPQSAHPRRPPGRSRDRLLLRARQRVPDTRRGRARAVACRRRGTAASHLRGAPRLREPGVPGSAAARLRAGLLACPARPPGAAHDLGGLRPHRESGVRARPRVRHRVLVGAGRPARRTPPQHGGDRGPGGRGPVLGGAESIQRHSGRLSHRPRPHPARVRGHAARGPHLPDRRRLHLGRRLRPALAGEPGRRPRAADRRPRRRPARPGGQRLPLHQPRRAAVLPALDPPVRPLGAEHLPRHRRTGAVLAEHRVPGPAGGGPP